MITVSIIPTSSKERDPDSVDVGHVFLSTSGIVFLRVIDGIVSLTGCSSLVVPRGLDHFQGIKVREVLGTLRVFGAE
jgi:hypothetical protein